MLNVNKMVLEGQRGGICTGDRSRTLKVPGSRCLVGVALKSGTVEQAGDGGPRGISPFVMVVFALVEVAMAGWVATTNDGANDPVARRGAPPGVCGAICNN